MTRPSHWSPTHEMFDCLARAYRSPLYSFGPYYAEQEDGRKISRWTVRSCTRRGLLKVVRTEGRKAYAWPTSAGVKAYRAIAGGLGR